MRISESAMLGSCILLLACQLCRGQVQDVAVEAAEAPAMLLDLQFTSDGARMITAGDAVRVFDTATGTLLHQHRTSRMTRTISLSPIRDELYATGNDEGKIQFWYERKPEPFASSAGYQGLVLDVDFLPDGKHLISCAIRYTEARTVHSEVRLIEYETGTVVHELDLPDTKISCAAISKDGSKLILPQYIPDSEEKFKSKLEVYELGNWDVVQSIPFADGFALDVALIEATGKLIITGGECVRLSPSSCMPTGRIWVANISSSEPATLIETPECGYFHSISLSPDEKSFATGTDVIRKYFNAQGRETGGAVISQAEVRDVETGALIWSKDCDVGDAYGVRFSPDGTQVACCSRSFVYLLDAATGEEKLKVQAKNR